MWIWIRGFSGVTSRLRICLSFTPIIIYQGISLWRIDRWWWSLPIGWVFRPAHEQARSGWIAMESCNFHNPIFFNTCLVLARPLLRPSLINLVIRLSSTSSITVRVFFRLAISAWPVCSYLPYFFHWCLRIVSWLQIYDYLKALQSGFTPAFA